MLQMHGLGACVGLCKAYTSNTRPQHPSFAACLADSPPALHMPDSLLVLRSP